MPELRKIHRMGLKFIGSRILGGFLLVFPVGLTLWIIALLYNILTKWAEWLLDIGVFSRMRGIFGFETGVRLVALVAVLALLFGIGLIGEYAIGERILRVLERGFLKIPMFNAIYLTAQKLIDALRNPRGGMFRKVVLFEYPRKGIYSIGFVTNEDNADTELSRKSGKNLVYVFLPTTPNPTSGFLLLVPKDDCVFLDMCITDAMRLVISGGVVPPHEDDATGQPFIAAAEDDAAGLGIVHEELPEVQESEKGDG